MRRRAASAGTTYNRALRALVDGCITVFELGFRRAPTKAAICTTRRLTRPLLTPLRAYPCTAAADHAPLRSEDDIRAELDACADVSVAECSDRVCETVAIVFITLETLPAGTLKRWGKADAVSTRSKELWRGFCRCVARKPRRSAFRLTLHALKAHQRRILPQRLRLVPHRPAAAGAGGDAGTRRGRASRGGAHVGGVSGAPVGCDGPG